MHPTQSFWVHAMLNRIFYSLGIRMILVLGMMMFGGIASLFSHSEANSSSKSANPWSKGHAASSSQAHAPSVRATPENTWVDKRTGRPATQEQIEDEAYRRQMLHEMRENYERNNGPVDTSNLDSPD